MEARGDRRVYHEKQRLQYCLLHALNNLFQEEGTFSRADLNQIAERLVVDDPGKQTWMPWSVVFKPHHNAITGNYDINVLIAAVEGKGKSVAWHDRRNGSSSISIDDDNLLGIVLNVPVRRFAGIYRGRHWIALRRIEEVWYNLDSDLAAPGPFVEAGDVREFMDNVIAGGGEVLLVMNE